MLYEIRLKSAVLLSVSVFFCSTLFSCVHPNNRRSRPRIVKVGAPVRDFAVADWNEKIVWLGDFVKASREEPQNPKEVLLVFFATWCTPCRHELSPLVEYQRSNQDVQVILVSLPTEDAESVILDLLDGDRNVFPVIIDKKRKVFDKFFSPNRYVMPLSYLINKSGRIEVRMLGFRKGSSVSKQLFDARRRK